MVKPHVVVALVQVEIHEQNQDGTLNPRPIRRDSKVISDHCKSLKEAEYVFEQILERHNDGQETPVEQGESRQEDSVS